MCSEKIITWIKNTILITAIVLRFLQFREVIDSTNRYVIPLLGLYWGISAYQEWQDDRDSASLKIIFAVFLFITTVIVWLR